MKTSNLTLALLLAVTPSAFAENKAESHTETTDSAGTKIKTEKSHEASTGWTGTQKAEMEEETTRDPKGMFNKTTESSKTEVKAKTGGDRVETTESKDAAGTKQKVTKETDVDNNWGGGTTTTTTTKKVTDPKGLMNKKTVEMEETVKRNADGTAATTVTKEVDGDTVSEETHKH